MDLVSHRERLSLDRPERQVYPSVKYFVIQQSDAVIEVSGRLKEVRAYDKYAVAGCTDYDNFHAEDFDIVALTKAGVNPSFCPVYFRATPEQMDALLAKGCVSLQELKDTLKEVPVEPTVIKESEPSSNVNS